MDWSGRYGADSRPTAEDISEFIHNDLWREMNDFLQQAYGVQPQTA